MDPTVAIAALGLLTTLAAAGYTSYVHRQSQRESRVFEARVAGYGELVATLYEYERATYNRVKARLGGRAHADRESFRQEAWATNAKARAAVGVVALLSDSRDLHLLFDSVRRSIGDLNTAASESDLLTDHEAIYAALDDVILRAKEEIAR